MPDEKPDLATAAARTEAEGTARLSIVFGSRVVADGQVDLA